MQGSGVTGATSYSDMYKTVLYVGKEDEVGGSTQGVGLGVGVPLPGMRSARAVYPGNEPGRLGHTLAGPPVPWIEETLRLEDILWIPVFHFLIEQC